MSYITASDLTLRVCIIGLVCGFPTTQQRATRLHCSGRSIDGLHIVPAMKDMALKTPFCGYCDTMGLWLRGLHFTIEVRSRD